MSDGYGRWCINPCEVISVKMALGEESSRWSHRMPYKSLAFGRPWRQAEGLLRSIMALLGVSLEIPDHATFSRRSTSLSLATLLTPSSEPVHVVLDSTGLKVYEAGEWQAEKHGRRSRPSWR